MKLPEKIIKQLALEHADIFADDYDDRQKLAVYSEARLNWVNAIISDDYYDWEQEELLIANLQLTGTIPEYNKIIIDKCERSPVKFAAYLKRENCYDLFVCNNKSNETILIEYRDGKYYVLHGMYHVIKLIINGQDKLTAWIGHNSFQIKKPNVEPSVAYFFLREYRRGTIPQKEKEHLLETLRLIYQYTNNGPRLLGDDGRLGWENAMQKLINEI
ncbi:MAG TPA: hypothetical protein PLZ62_02040 [bacterium]|nr:hypothetical protein [bacterium]